MVPAQQMSLDEACKLAIDHLATHGPSDITIEKVEKSLIEAHLEEFKEETRAKINRGNVFDMGFKSIQYLLTPKNRYVFDYRKAAIIDPACVAKYTALVFQAAPVIEKLRLPISQNIVYSSRFKPGGGDVFDKEINYNSWREQVKFLANASDCTYVVQCDIASFYDRVNIHRIESTLADVGVQSGLIKQINDLLLFWSKKDSYGIPVGNTASRILAEAALIDIDNFLVQENVKFVRYVDDYRFFAPDLLTAQRWMNMLTTRLFRDGLMLNTGKTKIYLATKSEDEQKRERVEESPEEVIKKVSKLTGGYNRISRTFIMPASEKYDIFKGIDIRHEIDNINSNGIPEFEGIQKLIIASLVQLKFDYLEDLARVCSQYLYSLDYFVDMLEKNSQFIPERNRKSITEIFSSLITSEKFGGLDWHQATLAKLLGNSWYFSKNSLLHVVKFHTKMSSTYASMVALEGLQGKMTRGDFLTIREWFDRCDDWEKRRMINASDALPSEERKAWAKAIKPIVKNDFFNAILAEKIIKNRN